MVICRVGPVGARRLNREFNNLGTKNFFFYKFKGLYQCKFFRRIWGECFIRLGSGTALVIWDYVIYYSAISLDLSNHWLLTLCLHFCRICHGLFLAIHGWILQRVMLLYDVCLLGIHFEILMLVIARYTLYISCSGSPFSLFIWVL